MTHGRMRWPGWSGTLAIAGVTWLLLDLLRAWTPGLITIFGRAAETPAELIGAFALAVLSAPLIVLLILGRPLTSSPTPLLASAGLALLARLAVPLIPGDRPLLWTASAGVALAVLALALAAARLGSTAVPGLFAGVALSATTHAALGTWGAVWRSDVPGWVVTATLVAVLASLPTAARQSPVTSVSRLVGWSILPVLLLAGITLANPARANVAAGGWGMAIVVVAGALAAAVPWLLAPGRPTRLVAALGLVAAAAVTMLPAAEVGGIAGRLPAWTVVGFAIGMPCAALLLTGLPLNSAPKAAGRAVGGGAVIFTVLLFAFYAGYDLGYRADLLIPVVALAVAVLALLAARSATSLDDTIDDVRSTSSRNMAFTAGAAAIAAILATVGPSLTIRPDAQISEDTTPPTVAAWNLRMGYGIDGTFRPDEVARVVRNNGVAILLLSEIDRGWLLNGGQDQLSILARLLDMDAVFNPVGDHVWGDAILSPHPLSNPRGEPLPAYESFTGAGILAATVDLPGGPVRVISTHLQPDADGPDPTLSQAGDLAARMTAEASSGIPVIMGGDLNTVPDSRAWTELLGTGFVDALAPARPLLTSSSDDLTSEIDHILVTEDLATSDPRTIETLLSDHLPVLVSLDR